MGTGAMTTELQRAMARYEEARGRYKTAVLGSLNGDSNGDAIRRAIQEFQEASAELRRVSPPAAAPPRKPTAEEKPALTPLEFVWKLLKAG
jgi:hypothetical protein